MSFSVQKIQSGDEQAFRILFDEFYQTLCIFASTMIRNDALAADIVQETSVKYWERRADFDNCFKVKSFLYTVVRNSCLNTLRDERRNVQEDLQEAEKEISFSNSLIERESYRMFYNAVDSLPAQTRRVILLALEGKNNAEIAKELQVTENNVHRLKKAAYRKLKEVLKDYYYLIFVFFH